jgi:ankyrin repeat protein
MPELARLPFGSGLRKYARQAEELLEAWTAGDAEAIRFIRKNQNHSGGDALDLADAQFALARWYDFGEWPSLVEWAEAVSREGSPGFRFERAVEAVIEGDAATLGRLVQEDPELVRARSMRAHGATLLHYIAANGVEEYRQKTPANAVEIAKMLLDAGAEADATAPMYGGPQTVMAMLVSSSHPAQAGVQVALVETLLDYGAAVEGRGSGRWASPLMTALGFGYRDTAETLVRRGAAVSTLAAAAGLGRFEDAVKLLPGADGEDRHRALALAAQHGHAEIVRMLLDAGEDPNRYNPKGFHGHSTPLHQAALAGHDAVVRLLVERGARPDIADTVYGGTPLDWAEYGGRGEIAEYLGARG